MADIRIYVLMTEEGDGRDPSRRKIYENSGRRKNRWDIYSETTIKVIRQI